jgi:hypothetical protein
MRLGVVTLLVALALAVGCGAEKQRAVVGEDDITAAHLRNLREDDSALLYLEPTEEEARQLAEEELAQAQMPPENHDIEEDPSTRDKVGQASIAFLQVAVTLGAMVAPYFLF